MRFARGIVGTARRKDRALGVVMVGTLLAMMVYTAPLATLPAIAADLGAGPAGSAWIISSMSVGFAVALIPTGALGDDIGRRRVFLAGAAVLAASSALAAAAPEPWVLVAARFVQGVGAGAVYACGPALIGVAYPPGPARTWAIGWWGASIGAGVAAGPVLMAVAQHGGSWRAGYVLLAVLSLALAVAGPALLTESTLGRRRGVDPVGAVLLGAGLGCLLAGLTDGRQGWGRPAVLLPLVAAAALLAAFPAHQLRARAPMLDLRAFRRPLLRSATVGAFATGAGVTALMAYVPTLLQRGLGGSALLSAALLLAWSATSAVSAAGVRVLPERFGGTARIGGGLALVGAGLAGLSGVHVGSTAGRLVAGLLVAGFGTGVVNATLGREAVASMPPDQAGTGSGLNNTSRYVGAALGVTVVAALAGGTQPAAVVSGWNVACWVCAATSVVGAAVALGSGRTPAA